MSTDELVIRKERPEDHSAVTEVTVEAFTYLGMGEVTEHQMIERLRQAGAYRFPWWLNLPTGWWGI